MDMTNPAVEQLTILSPRDIADIQTNPALIEEVARAMGAVNLDNLFRQMQSPEVGVAHKLEFQRLLNKMGRLEPMDKAAGDNSKFSVVINIPGAQSTVIESSATVVPDDE